jgi:hypothetical protein
MPRKGDSEGGYGGRRRGGCASLEGIAGVGAVRRGAGLENVQFPAARHGLRPAVHVEFAVQVLQVLLDRAQGDD